MEAHGVPQRVCPHCATISTTRDQHCPWCGNRYIQRVRSGAGVGALAALLLVHAAVVLCGVALMLMSFGDTLESELDTQVTAVERDIERNFDDVVEEVRKELDDRLPAVP